MSIGKRLKEERERLGFTVVAFAEAAGAKKHTVIDWQNDVSSPPAARLARLAACGVDVMYVLTGVHLPQEYQQNIGAMIAVTSKVDPDGSTAITEKMLEVHKGLADSLRQPAEPELKLTRKDRAFWEMYKELDEKDQREIYHGIQEKKRLADLEKYYQENERKKNA